MLAHEPIASNAQTQRKITLAHCSHHTVSTPECHPKATHQKTLHRAVTRVGRCQETRLNHRIELRRNVFSPRGTANLLDERRFHTLASQRFQARLTLFPKYFASFPHGTSVLLDSSTCGVLNGVYHQIGALISESATLQAHAVRILPKDRTGFSPSIIPNAKGLPSASMLTTCCTKL